MAKEVRKVVLFNVDNPTENELFDYASRMPNFSGQIKRWLAMELKARQQREAMQKPAAATLKVDL